MTQKGLLERVGWGKYRVNSSEKYLAKKTNIAGSYDLLKKACMSYALTGPDAVFFWTKGGYRTDNFLVFIQFTWKLRNDIWVSGSVFLALWKWGFTLRPTCEADFIWRVLCLVSPGRFWSWRIGRFLCFAFERNGGVLPKKTFTLMSQLWKCWVKCIV